MVEQGEEYVGQGHEAFMRIAETTAGQDDLSHLESSVQPHPPSSTKQRRNMAGNAMPLTSMMTCKAGLAAPPPVLSISVRVARVVPRLYRHPRLGNRIYSMVVEE